MHTAIRDNSHRIIMLNLLLAAAAVSLLAGYIAMNNRAAEKAFAIRAEEVRIVELKEKRQQLDLAVVSAQSMGSIDAGVTTLGLVPVSSVEYVEASSGAVAVK